MNQRRRPKRTLRYRIVQTHREPLRTFVRRGLKNAQAMARQVVMPNLRYPNDIGQKLIDGDFAALRRLGYLPSTLAL